MLDKSIPCCENCEKNRYNAYLTCPHIKTCEFAYKARDDEIAALKADRDRLLDILIDSPLMEVVVE